jgi:hypothetical protein
VLAMRRTAALCLLTLLAYAATEGGRARRFGREMRLLAVLVALLLVAALSASPSWYQYFYAPVPFLLLACSYALADRGALRGRRIFMTAAVIVIAGSVIGFRPYAQALGHAPRSWTAVCIHRVGEEVAHLAGEGRVLTLTPIVPLEGGAAIYPELATGPFAWRTAFLVPRDERARIHVAGPQDIKDLTENRPPAAVLTGVDTGDDAAVEAPLVRFAHARGFAREQVLEDVILWAAGPTARDDAISCDLHG